jgi:hypothetical protein
MAPKKLSDKLRALRRSLSFSHADPEEGKYIDEDNNPPLNQEGALNPTFDPIVASPAIKGKSLASSSAATIYENSEAAARNNFTLETQEEQKKQLQQLFSLVSSLGSEFRSLLKVVAENESQRIKDDGKKSGPSQKDTGKAASRSVSFADLEKKDKEIKGDDNNNDDGNNDDLANNGMT